MASAAIDDSQIQYAGRRANSGTRNATLASIGEGLTKVAGNYQATEESTQQGFSSIASRLG